MLLVLTPMEQELTIAQIMKTMSQTQLGNQFTVQHEDVGNNF